MRDGIGRNYGQVTVIESVAAARGKRLAFWNFEALRGPDQFIQLIASETTRTTDFNTLVPNQTPGSIGIGRNL